MSYIFTYINVLLSSARFLDTTGNFVPNAIFRWTSTIFLYPILGNTGHASCPSSCPRTVRACALRPVTKCLHFHPAGCLLTLPANRDVRREICRREYTNYKRLNTLHTLFRSIRRGALASFKYIPTFNSILKSNCRYGSVECDGNLACCGFYTRLHVYRS